MIAEFMHFYSGYDLNKVLNLYAVSFYSLYTNIFRVKGFERIEKAHTLSSVYAGGEALDAYMKDAKKQSQGLNYYIDQINLLRKLKGKKK